MGSRNKRHRSKRIFPSKRVRRIKMRRLVDKWTPAVLILFSFIKILQFLRLLGFGSREGGWRKAARSYLRTEHSKFSLTVFRLTFWSDSPDKRKKDFESSSSHLIARLRLFLEGFPASYWRIEWLKFSAKPRPKRHIDMTEVSFDDEGNLCDIRPHCDMRYGRLPVSDAVQQSMIHRTVIQVYNELKDVHDKIRPWLLRERIYRSLLVNKDIPKGNFNDVLRYVERILSSMFICFEVLPRDHDEFDIKRFEDPQFIKKKHPGQGLLNILCRFNADFDQADLWIQINHVPVDGVPMQEVLSRLKEEWGTAGELKYPGLSKQRSITPVLCTTKKGKKGMYSSYRFVDFRPLIAARRKLNASFAERIGGSITLVSMFLWGLAHEAIFHNKKFVFTVDLEKTDAAERTPGVVFIRPEKFIDRKTPIAGFLNYQIELNARLVSTRARSSESYELMELYALTSPIVYWLTRKCMPHAMAEFVGTIGVTMIKDADIFLSPLSDINTDGFLALGSLRRPTVDGEEAGYVSARAPRDKVNRYLDAVEVLAEDFGRYV